jgi:hypothetical protein
MKTAMQELIDELKLIEAYPMITLVLRMANDLLEKEKEQICDSYVEGLEGLYMGAEEYYNKTYS